MLEKSSCCHKTVQSTKKNMITEKVKDCVDWLADWKDILLWVDANVWQLTGPLRCKENGELMLTVRQLSVLPPGLESSGGLDRSAICPRCLGCGIFRGEAFWLACSCLPSLRSICTGSWHTASTISPSLEDWRGPWAPLCLFFLRPAPTGTFRRVPPAVQYRWQFLQKCRGWLIL